MSDLALNDLIEVIVPKDCIKVPGIRCGERGHVIAILYHPDCTVSGWTVQFSESQATCEVGSIRKVAYDEGRQASKWEWCGIWQPTEWRAKQIAEAIAKAVEVTVRGAK